MVIDRIQTSMIGMIPVIGTGDNENLDEIQFDCWEQVELKMAQLGHVESQFEFQAAELHQLQEDQRRNEGSARSHRISASQKDDRIEELEEALRESVRITADREMALHNETQLRIQISEKVFPLRSCGIFLK